MPKALVTQGMHKIGEEKTETVETSNPISIGMFTVHRSAVRIVDSSHDLTVSSLNRQLRSQPMSNYSTSSTRIK
jgi:hypothetical protein